MQLTIEESISLVAYNVLMTKARSLMVGYYGNYSTENSLTTNDITSLVSFITLT